MRYRNDERSNHTVARMGGFIANIPFYGQNRVRMRLTKGLETLFHRVSDSRIFSSFWLVRASFTLFCLF
jgi:hypothetical protein